MNNQFKPGHIVLWEFRYSYYCQLVKKVNYGNLSAIDLQIGTDQRLENYYFMIDHLVLLTDIFEGVKDDVWYKKIKLLSSIFTLI